MKHVDIPQGTRFGKLTVLRRSESKGHGPMFECVCACGKTAIVRSHGLRSGHHKSCGCEMTTRIREYTKLHTIRPPEQRRTHGVWKKMISRTTNTKNPSWSRYGGRGIICCDRWLSFDNFIEDMGIAPDGLSIDRIDNDGNYAPGNCRWATAKMQARNKSCTKRIIIDGEWKTIADLSDRTGITSDRLRRRLENGADASRLLDLRDMRGRRFEKIIEWNGQKKNMAEWARTFGIKDMTLRGRYRRGIRPPELFQFRIGRTARDLADADP